MATKNRHGKKFKILLAGGGSGGHVSPLKAIAKTLSDEVGSDNLHNTFVCEKGGQFDELMNQPYVHSKKKITAGKFRRYHGDSFLSHVLDIKTLLFNFRDLFKFLFGCIEAFLYLLGHRPDVIFLKGGFVCVPIGWAAALLRIPYVTHDSDAVPGLANRLTAKRAVKNLIAIDGNYPYDSSKTIITGVPINNDFFDSSSKVRDEARQTLSIPQDANFVLITGGGLGAKKMNASVIDALNKIATSEESDTDTQDMYIAHITGKALYEDALDKYENTQLNPEKVNVVDFTTDMLRYVRAANIVISRAGATAIAEFAAAKKACIFIPGAHLTGGQQVHNASILDKENAAIIVLEQDIEGIVTAITELAKNVQKREALSSSIAKFAVKDSAYKIVELLLEISGYNNTQIIKENSSSTNDEKGSDN